MNCPRCNRYLAGGDWCVVHGSQNDFGYVPFVEEPSDYIHTNGKGSLTQLICMKCGGPKAGRKNYCMNCAKSVRHGASCYTNYGCRCEICKKGASDVWQNYQAKRRAVSA